MNWPHIQASERLPVPPEIARDWPESLFQVDSLRGILVKALGSTLASAFQPIFDRHNHHFADEALLRASVRDKAISPPQAFASARQGHKLVAFDRLCRTLHVMNYSSYAQSNRLLFLNVHPELLENETVAVDASAIGRAVKNYRAKGYRIALDDFGHGMANLDRLWLLEPDFVKLDRHILALAAQQDKARQGYAKLVSLLHDAGSQVIAEGVETQIEKSIALDSGVDGLQGFFLARPNYRPL
ncbi:EAL domain-containing protein [Chitinibacter sp. GC72]|uniref:EAL domain-containing protein n=1 Tax=Chitinibacter sp. GC72 TaxID=1526917 RepID=UPI0012FB52DD|nr:EAL domain-containing protein [Chitinibacter sp. GC72]